MNTIDLIQETVVALSDALMGSLGQVERAKLGIELQLIAGDSFGRTADIEEITRFMDFTDQFPDTSNVRAWQLGRAMGRGSEVLASFWKQLLGYCPEPHDHIHNFADMAKTAIESRLPASFWVNRANKKAEAAVEASKK